MIIIFWVVSFAHSLHSFRLASFFRKWRPRSLLNVQPSEQGGPSVHQPALPADELGRREGLRFASDHRAGRGEVGRLASYLGSSCSLAPSPWFSLRATGVRQYWGQAERDGVGVGGSLGLSTRQFRSHFWPDLL